MATPTPVTYTQWDGTRGLTYWRAEWSTADNFTDTAVVDISSLTGAGPDTAPNAVKVLEVKAVLNGDIEATLEFDATTDQLIYVFEGQTDSTLVDTVGFWEAPSGGRVPTSSAAGFVGDIMLTTANVASGDELTLVILYERKR